MNDKLKTLNQQGYARIKVNNEVIRIDEAKDISENKNIFLVVDRIIIRDEDDFFNRLADAVYKLLFLKAKANCIIETLINNSEQRDI